MTLSAHSQTFLSLHLRQSSFSNPSVALPTSQFILQPFRCFTYVTAHSPTLLPSQALHLRQLPSCPWWQPLIAHIPADKSNFLTNKGQLASRMRMLQYAGHLTKIWDCPLKIQGTCWPWALQVSFNDWPGKSVQGAPKEVFTSINMVSAEIAVPTVSCEVLFVFCRSMRS